MKKISVIWMMLLCATMSWAAGYGILVNTQRRLQVQYTESVRYYKSDV